MTLCTESNGQIENFTVNLTSASNASIDSNFDSSVGGIVNDDSTLNDDYAGSTATSGAIGVGGLTTGDIETGGDEDWFAINLVQGQQYKFDLEGSPSSQGTLSDTLLRLLDAGGQ